MARTATAALIALTLAGGAVLVASTFDIERAARLTADAQAWATAWSRQNTPEWVVAAYNRRPALVIGLAGLLAVPPLSLVGLLLLRRRKGTPNAAAVRDATASEILLATEGEAWLEIEGATGEPQTAPQRLPGRDLIQIGREPDNDICLVDSSVHRYHAVIERSPDSGFVITDMSGPKGNGVRINGALRRRASLGDGDVVELGRMRLRFAMAHRQAAAA